MDERVVYHDDYLESGGFAIYRPLKVSRIDYNILAVYYRDLLSSIY